MSWVHTVCPGDDWCPHLNSSEANGKELSGNMALPEGCQALLPKDALHSLQDAVVLGRGVSGGELLNLELEEMEKIFSVSSFNTGSSVQFRNSQPCQPANAKG